MENPLISVLMTTYNADKYLPFSIESVLNQTYENIQFIIVDDGSTDQSRSVIESYEDPRIEFYHLDKNQHIVMATNYGRQYVRGELLAIMDSDDIWELNKLKRQLMYLQEHPEHKACFTWVNIIDENGDSANDSQQELVKLYDAHTDTREEWLRFFFYIGNRLNNPSSIVYTDIANEIGPQNPFYVQGQDFDWWIRLTKKYSFGILEERLINYRRFLHSNTKNTSTVSDETDTRFYNEYMQMRYHFFEGMTDETFIRTFKDHFRFHEASSKEELLCEKAFLICSTFSSSSYHSALGLLKIEELVNNPDTRTVLENTYDLLPKDFYKVTGMHLYNDPTLQSGAKEIERLQSLSKSQKEYLDFQQVHIQKLEQEMVHKTQHEKDLEEAMQQKEALNVQLNQQLIDANEQLAVLQERINSMENSSSWKLTKPLRSLKK
ncbi:MAG: glycosyltransferase [Lachnospiraceae bacterium]|nr:glycosyltransferase [Lachnospiraceae bacterium]MDD3615905.1 glycosyltransferase [Lachnospiraceae bacterium]